MAQALSSLCFLLALGAPVESPAPMGYYEWVAVSPIVVAARNLGDDGKFTEFEVEQVLRGDLAAGQILRVLVRRANRERSANSTARRLRPELETSYLLLLEPAPRRGSDALPVFELVRGTRGARELRAEGAPALLAALQRFVAIQDRNDDGHTWRELGEMLEATDPLLIETALEQFVKFRRGEPDRLPSIRPLLEHPLESIRERAARLVGQTLERQGTDRGLAEVELVQNELIAHARRDSSVPVRVAATEALGQIGGARARSILEEIARTDPDQSVRYAAEKLVFERRRETADSQPSARPTAGGPGQD